VGRLEVVGLAHPGQVPDADELTNEGPKPVERGLERPDGGRSTVLLLLSLSRQLEQQIDRAGDRPEAANQDIHAELAIFQAPGELLSQGGVEMEALIAGPRGDRRPPPVIGMEVASGSVGRRRLRRDRERILAEDGERIGEQPLDRLGVGAGPLVEVAPQPRPGEPRRRGRSIGRVAVARASRVAREGVLDQLGEKGLAQHAAEPDGAVVGFESLQVAIDGLALDLAGHESADDRRQVAAAHGALLGGLASSLLARLAGDTRGTSRVQIHEDSAGGTGGGRIARRVEGLAERDVVDRPAVGNHEVVIAERLGPRLGWAAALAEATAAVDHPFAGAVGLGRLPGHGLHPR
jgi:hypothetical protein